MKIEFLNKANENLAAAKICFDNELYNACANRTYYSALHSAIAALFHRGIRRDTIDHKKVQSDFSSELIGRRKIYPSKLKSYLSDIQLLRNQADYTDEDVSRQKAYRRLSMAKELLEIVEKEIVI
ncbi:MAG: HEPN domain-containing protein [Desulfobacteraceae bacterium]|nr:HEPN domain-containing protein [Desulfobacteraceae bacterium]